MIDLTQLSKSDLDTLSKQIELQKQKIHEEEVKNQKTEVREKIEKLRKHKDIILSLLKHSCSSCNDEHPRNGYSYSMGYARCSKCFLTEILNDEWQDGDFDVSFDVNITRVI